ncbi:MAG: aminotransferase class I/II-fold pyridoxal phosphate-dependent enzyme [Acidimicrobiia bacterium]|nr:aminotransferase class I/II-fold pyridoxal phosphate-dependent enzyme [Acidimicrobiia bacterium]MDH4309481.1 aminotransferase class I/II-fold pyridoxal phosphate-dependent enzyme [Acidimicrobiia bacterium]MDH5292820.1 aminotransferase class I/II-fold pyridoxal phosphate-dependent enzyme [Acidimicrobiia bacterium]
MRATTQDRHERVVQTIQANVQAGVDHGLLAQHVDDVSNGDGTVQIDGRTLANFGSCSYLGLCGHPDLERAALDGIKQFGVSFSSSRLYAALPYYAELEQKLSEITGGHVIAAGSTTLAHLSALPSIVGGDAIVLLDRAAHSSLHLTTQLLQARGVPVHLVPHNDLVALESMVEQYSAEHDQVWFVGDGVYSMLGDIGDNNAIIDMVARHDKMYAYIDDAHGFGWAGRHGRGVALSERDMHPRLVVAVSLSKAFGAGGGAIVVGDCELHTQIMLRGGPLMFGGPIQVAELAAGVAAADLLLSPELGRRQERLIEQIHFVRHRSRELGIPMAAWDSTPIWFVRIGPLEPTRAVGRHLIERGHWTNHAGFPVVPVGRAGVRFTHTLNQSLDQLNDLLESIAEALALHVPNADVVDLTELETAG